MKKGKSPNKNRSIDQYEFLITPLSLKFDKKQQNSFLIYIEKGAQVLGKIQQKIQAKQLQHKFQSNQVKRFRIASQKTVMTYKWSLYRFTEDGQEEYFQSVDFSIKNCYQLYVKDLERLEDDLYRIYAEKQKKTQIQQIWKDLKNDLTKNETQMVCIFSKIKAKVNFKITIKCDLDFIYEEWAAQKQKKKQQKQTSMKRRSSVNSQKRTPDVSFIASDKQQSIENNQKNNKKSTSSQVLFLNVKPIPEKQFFSESQQKQHHRNIEIGTQNVSISSQNLRESQIKIIDPEGVDVTARIPEKFLNHKRTYQEDAYYTQKKSSMLSDIIQLSCEGSSNINMSNSNPAQRLKSVDQIREEQESLLFSPIVRTQTFESQKHDQMFNIKRTNTFRHRPSQEFEVDNNSNSNYNKNNHKPEKKSLGFTTYQVQADHEDNGMNVSEIRKTSSRSTSEIKEREKQLVNQQQVQNTTVKNIVKIILIGVILLLIINSFNLFQGYNKQQKDEDFYYKRKDNKIDKKQKNDNKQSFQKIKQKIKTKKNSF